MSDPPGTAGDTYGLMEGPLTSDPREKKKHFILDEIDTHLDHLEQEEKHSLWQNFWFFVMVHTYTCIHTHTHTHMYASPL